jgi:hypothetical protein
MRARTVLVPATLAALLCCLAAFSSCDKPKSAAVAEDATIPIPQLQVDALAQLLANRLTHVTDDSAGNLYWVQESDDGRDVMYVMGAGGDEVPRATALTSDAILDAMPPVKLPEKPPAPTAAKASTGKSKSAGTVRRGGNIQSIAGGADGEVYFYFAGGIGSVTRCCLGRFDARPRSGAAGQFRILADASQLASASGMGLSIALARGKVVTSGQLVRLLLRHSDGWAMFEFDSHRIPTSGAPQLLRPFERIVIDEHSPGERRGELDLTRETTDVSPGANADELLVSDRAWGAMYRVNHEGTATMIASLIGLSETLSPPVADRLRPVPRPQDPWPPPATSPTGPDVPDANGRVASIVFFAADGREIDPANSARPDPADVQTQYPALLVIQSNRYRAVGRDNIRGSGSVTTYTLRLRQLVPIGRDTWAGYDAASGQIMRVKLFEKR